MSAPGRRPDRGFTLLEVVVAMAILGLSLLAIFNLNSGAIASHAYAKRLTLATMLARSKMTDLEQELYDKGYDVDDEQRQGDFRAEGWDAFTWKASILAPRTQDLSPDKLMEALFAVPGGASGLAQLFGGGKDGGVGGLGTGGLPAGLAGALGAAGSNSSSGGPTLGALGPGATQAGGASALGPFGGLAQTQMTQLLDQIKKSIREVHLTVSWKEGTRTESIDLVTHLVSLRQGSDRNGTPGAPLSGSATGQPGANGVPGANGLPSAGSLFQGGIPGLNPGQPNNGILGPNRGNTIPGAQLDPNGRPIR